MALVLFMIVKTINKISSMFHEEKIEEESEPKKSNELIALEKIVSLLEEKK